MQPTMTYGPGGPVAVPMQNPLVQQTEAKKPQRGQPKMIMVPAYGAMGGHSQVMQFPTSRATPTAPVSQEFEFDLENIDIFFLFYIYIVK